MLDFATHHELANSIVFSHTTPDMWLVAAVAMGVFARQRLHEHLRAMPHTLTALDDAV